MYKMYTLTCMNKVVHRRCICLSLCLPCLPANADARKSFWKNAFSLQRNPELVSSLMSACPKKPPNANNKIFGYMYVYSIAAAAAATLRGFTSSSDHLNLKSCPSSFCTAVVTASRTFLKTPKLAGLFSSLSPPWKTPVRTRHVFHP